MAENMIPEGLLQERRDRLRLLRDEAQRKARQLTDLSADSRLTPAEQRAKMDYESMAATYEDSIQIMGVGMTQPTAFYPVWMTKDQALYLIHWFGAWDPTFLSDEPTMEEQNWNNLKEIVTKLKGSAGSKGSSDPVYQAALEATTPHINTNFRPLPPFEDDEDEFEDGADLDERDAEVLPLTEPKPGDRRVKPHPFIRAQGEDTILPARCDRCGLLKGDYPHV